MLHSLELVLVATLLGTAGADETYTIKIKEDTEGSTALVEKKITDRQKATLTDKDGNEHKGKETTKTTTYVYRQTILKKAAGERRPTRLKRAYQKARVTEDGRSRTLPYEGKTVLIEKSGGKYTFRIEEGDELTGEDAALLTREFEMKREEDTDWKKVVLPERPVRLNEPWKIKLEPIILDAERNGLLVDASRSTGTGKLVRVYKKDGHQFGVMEFRVTLAPKAMRSPGKPEIAFERGGKLVFTDKVDDCIDGSIASGKLEGRMELRVQAPVPSADQPNGHIALDNRRVTLWRQTEVKGR
jgi:hypothetical protein